MGIHAGVFVLHLEGWQVLLFLAHLVFISTFCGNPFINHVLLTLLLEMYTFEVLTSTFLGGC